MVELLVLELGLRIPLGRFFAMLFGEDPRIGTSCCWKKFPQRGFPPIGLLGVAESLLELVPVTLWTEVEDCRGRLLGFGVEAQLEKETDSDEDEQGRLFLKPFALFKKESILGQELKLANNTLFKQKDTNYKYAHCLKHLE